MDGYLDPNHKLNVWASKNISVELKNLEGLIRRHSSFYIGLYGWIWKIPTS